MVAALHLHGRDLKIIGLIKNSEILIYSINGVLVRSHITNDENELSIKTIDLAKGFYILKIINKNSKEVKTLKIETYWYHFKQKRHSMNVFFV